MEVFILVLFSILFIELAKVVKDSVEHANSKV